jgi:hypothetical protein
MTAAGDQFSLAALAYEWMTGRRAPSAFVGGDMVPVPGADREALAAIFARALHPDPDRRFASCGEFVTAVAEVAALMADEGGESAGEARPRKRVRTPVVPSLPLDAGADARLDVAPPLGTTVEPLESVPPQTEETAGALDHWSDAAIAPDRMSVAEPHVAIDESPAATSLDIAPPPPEAFSAAPTPPISTAPEPLRFGRDDRSGPFLGSTEPTPSGFGVPTLIAAIIFGVAIGLGVATFLWGRTAPTAPATGSGATSAPAAEAPPAAAPQAAPPSASGEPVPLSDPEPRVTPAPEARSPARTPATEPVPAPPGSPAARPAAPAPAAPAPAAAVGNLLVRTSPEGATVFIDGDRRGVTPLTVQKLPLGTRRVRVQRDGFTAEERQVALTRSRPSRSLDLRLTRTEAPAAAASAATTAKTGTLVIESRPTGATVLINGRPAGTTPVTVGDLAPGSYTVQLQLADFRPISTTVRVVAGERARVAASLTSVQEP